MDHIAQAKEYLKNYDFSKSMDKKHDGFVILGAISLYELTKDAQVKDTIIDFVNNTINEDGTIKDYKEDYAISYFIPGRAYIFAYEVTKEEKYKNAADVLIKQLQTQPRENGCFAKNGKDGKTALPCYNGCDALYPFYASYGTKYGKKENYNDLIAQMRALYELSDIKNLETKKLALYANMLADLTKEVSEEIYEHRRNIADKLKTVCQELVLRTDCDNTDKMMMAKALLKAGNERAILSEKYVDIAVKNYNEAKEQVNTPMFVGAQIEAAVLCSIFEN